ncbi:MAG: hypothetical protein K2X00_07435 [Nitrospiraceae bacterium]|jgi:hypothetical protein|nr:hypothetical protein [Nitrospiraceae bacterium]OQW67302.1 MAG: hypothetical protein BVN29_03320 [Nitrospira sp. ST-bin5]
MLTSGRTLVTERLVSLERTIDSLNGQLREVRWELGHAKAEPLPIRLWRNLVGSRSEQEYMSTVCNRNVRPNTKVVSHGRSRA